MHYRQIYERTYKCSLLPGIEIHHIDGDSSNNDPRNLLAVTIEEHLQIHTSQKDWGAVQAILMRLENRNADIAEAARKKQRELVEANKHNFQKMSKERRTEISRKTGIMTRDLGIGIHKLNANCELAKENARKAGKASQAKRRNPEYAHLNKMQGKAVSGTKWFHNTETGERVRTHSPPQGEHWIPGTGSQKIIKRKDVVKNTTWWYNTITKEHKRLASPPEGENWKKGIFKK